MIQKILFVLFTTALLNACGGSIKATSRTLTDAEYAEYQKLKTEAKAKADAGNALGTTEATPTPAPQKLAQATPQPAPEKTVSTPPAPAPAPLVATRAPVAQTAPVAMTAPAPVMIRTPTQALLAPYATPQQMVYPGGTNESIAYGVATLDGSRGNCDNGCISFRYAGLMSPPPYARQSNAMSVSIDGMALPMSYYGNRTPTVWGDFLMANGQKETRQLYAVPAMKDRLENLRIRLKDNGKHVVTICFYFQGAKEIPIGGTVRNVPYHFLHQCLRYNVSINRPSYTIQDGRKI